MRVFHILVDWEGWDAINIGHGGQGASDYATKWHSESMGVAVGAVDHTQTEAWCLGYQSVRPILYQGSDKLENI